MLSITIWLLAFQFSFGQEQEKVSLETVLQQIEQQYDARFSYADSSIKGVLIARPAASLRFRESVQYLKTHTLLNYTFTSKKEIAISAPGSKTACGIILNEAQKPLQGATISNGALKVRTDDQGFFRIPIDETTNTFEILLNGYDSQTILSSTLATLPCLSITLTRSIEQLDEIIVTDFVARGIDIESDGGLAVNFQEIEILPGVIESDVLLTAQAVPGVQSVDERVSELNIRGGTQDQNLISWDGVKLYQSGHFFGLISAVNPNLTDRVRIYKNGTPARYTDGVSGTIEMQSSKKITDSLEASIDLNLINAGGFIDAPLGEKASLQISARKSLSSLWETPTYRQYFDRVFQDTEVIRNGSNSITATDNELFSFYDTSLRLLYKPTPRDIIQLNGLVVDNEISFRESAVINNTNERQESNASQNNLAGSIQYSHLWNDQWTTMVQLYGSNYTLRGTNFDLVNNQRLMQTNDVLEDGVRLEADFIHSVRKRFQFGYHFNETGITNIQDINIPLFRSAIKEVIRSHGLYGTMDYKSKNGTSRWVLGLRGQYYDKIEEFSLEPRLFFSQNLTHGLSLTLSGERKSQATSQTVNFQSDFLGIESRRWILANNSSVPLIQSYQGALGLTYDVKNWLVTAEGYYKNVDGITLQSQGFQNQLQFVRGVGSYTTRGIELLLQKRWKNFNFRTGYTLAENDYLFKNLPNSLIATFPNNVDLRHSVKSAFSYAKEKLRVSAGINWHSGRPITNLVADTPVQNNGLNYEAPNSSTLSNYFRFDLSAMYTFELGDKLHAELGASVWNILNNENSVNQYFLLSENQPTTIEERALEFTPNFSVKIRYH